MQTLIDLVRARAAENPDLTVFTFQKYGARDGDSRTETLTLRELDERARAVASRLQAEGAQGERVVLCYPPGLDYIEAFFGCLYAGAIAVPAYPPDPSRMNQSWTRLIPILRNSGARFALATTQFQWLQRLIPGKPPELKGLTWIASDKASAKEAARWRQPDVRPDSMAFLQYTSGSTGDPKGVMISHANLLHNLDAVARQVGVDHRDRGVIWLPPYHDLGLIGGILIPVHTRLPVTLLSPLDFLRKPVRWLELMHSTRATVTGGPGFAYDLCVRKIPEADRARFDLSSWRAAFVGAEPVRAATIEQFTAAFAPCGFRAEAFYPTFGMAEGTLIVSGADWSAGRARRAPSVARLDGAALEAGKVAPARAGAPSERVFVGNGPGLADQRLIVVDPDSRRRLPEGAVGELWLQGPSVAQGYWGRPEDTERDIKSRLVGDGDAGVVGNGDAGVAGDEQAGPFLRSGDLGFIDASGEVYLTGRLKDLIIIRGRNLYPQDLETTAIQAHAALRPGGTVAFAGAAPGGGAGASPEGERLALVCELSRTALEARPKREWAVLAAEAASEIRQALSREHGVRVEELALIEPGTLPKTSSGKMQRREAARRLAAGELKAVYRWSAEGGEPEAARAAAPAAVSVAESASVPASGIGHGAAGPAQAPESAPHWAIGILSRESAVPAAAIRPEHRLGDELGLDSLMLANLHSLLAEALPEAERGKLNDLSPDTSVAALIACLPAEPPANLAQVLAQGAAQGAGSARGEAEWDIARFPEVERLRGRFEDFERAGMGNPYFKTRTGPARDTVEMDGRDYVHFSGYNYLGLAGDPRVSDAAKSAIDRHGTTVSASRLASGEIPLHRELELEIAKFLGTEDAIVMVAGHPTNVTVIGRLVGPGDLILHDSLSHDSIIQGCLLSGAQRRPFPHNDAQALDGLLALLRPHYRRVLIVTEGAYSMDGDICPLPELVEVKKRHRAMLYVDEAHSIGVLGATGRGVCEHFKINPADVDALMGTMSKALASCGGYVAGSKAMVDFLKYTVPGFVYSVGLPPSNAAAALEALRIIQDERGRVETLKRNGELFLKLARARGLDTGPSDGTPIVPVIVGDSMKCLKLSEALAARGINAQPILHPAVAESATRIRFFLTACHTEEQIRTSVDALAEEWAKL